MAPKSSNKNDKQFKGAGPSRSGTDRAALKAEERRFDDILRRNSRDLRRAGWLSGEAFTAYGAGFLLFFLLLTLSSLFQITSWYVAAAAAVLAILLGRFVRRRVRRMKTIPRGYALVAPQGSDTDPTSQTIGTTLVTCSALVIAVYGGTAAPAVMVGALLALIVIFRNFLYLRSSLEQAAGLLFLLPAVLWLLAPLGLDPVESFGLSGTIDSLFMILYGRIFNKSYLRKVMEGIDLKTLTEALDSEDMSRRMSALSYLVYRPDARVLDRVVELSLSPDRDTAFAAQYALAGSWGSAPLLTQEIGGVPMQEALESLPTRMRTRMEEEIFYQQQAGRRHQQSVEEELGRLAPADRGFLSGLIALADGTASQTKEAQLVALEMLGATNSGAAYAALVRHLLSPDREVADAAMVGFYGAGLPVLQVLETVLKSPVAWMRKRAIQAAYYYLDYLHENRPTECREAYSTLAPVTSELLTHRNSATRAYALYLVDSSDSTGVDILKGACEDSSFLVRGEALVHLTALVPEEAREYVKACLKDPRAMVRITALTCAAELHMDELSDVYKYMAEQDPVLRVARVAQSVLMESKRRLAQ